MTTIEGRLVLSFAPGTLQALVDNGGAVVVDDNVPSPTSTPNDEYDAYLERYAMSAHIGTPGRRYTFDGVYCEFREEFEKFNRDMVVYRFLHAGRNQLVWFVKAENDPGLQVGKVYELEADIERHDSYLGCLQTRLRRVFGRELSEVVDAGPAQYVRGH